MHINNSKSNNSCTFPNIAHWIYNFQTEEIVFCEDFYKMLGYTHDTLPATKESFMQLLHPDDLNIFNDFVERFRDKSAQYSLEYELRLKNSAGKWIWVSTNSETIEDITQDFTSVCVAHTDITKYKEREIAICKSAQKYRQVVQRSRLSVCLLSQDESNENPNDYVISYCNSAFENLFNLNSDEIIDNKFNKFIKEHMEFIVDRIMPELNRKGIFRVEDFNLNIQKWLDVFAFFADEKTIAIAIEDITDRKNEAQKLLLNNRELMQKVRERTIELEQSLENLSQEIAEKEVREVELKTTTDELEKTLNREMSLNVMKSSFISMISHEYRTPLTTIQTSMFIIESLFHAQKEKEFMKYVNIITDTIKTMILLLENVLMLDYDENKITVNPIKINIIPIINDIISEIDENYKHKNNIKLTSHKTSVIFSTDIIHLSTILKKLIDNACKFSPKESDINVEIDFDEEAAKLAISIMDKGIGIPKKEIGDVFEPFVRGSNVNATGGVGLGLAIVKKYAKMINADIKIDSILGTGTNVIVILSELAEINNV